MTELERIHAELDRDRKRWTIRRRITITCVLLNAWIIAFYMFTVFFLDQSQSEMLKDFNSISITIIGGNFSVVLAYFGLNTYEDNHK